MSFVPRPRQLVSSTAFFFVLLFSLSVSESMSVDWKLWTRCEHENSVNESAGQFVNISVLLVTRRRPGFHSGCHLRDFYIGQSGTRASFLCGGLRFYLIIQRMLGILLPDFWVEDVNNFRFEISSKVELNSFAFWVITRHKSCILDSLTLEGGTNS